MSEKRRDRKGRLLQPNERQRANGMYEYRYSDSNGRKHSVYSWKLVSTDRAPSGKRCDKSLRELEAEIQKNVLNGVDAHAANIETVEDCFKQFMETKSRLNRKSRDIYENLYQTRVSRQLGNTKIAALTQPMLRRHYLNLLNDGTTVSTIRHLDSMLSQMFDIAISNHAINYNPCKGLLKSMKADLRNDNERVHCLTIQEQEAFLSFTKCSARHAHWYPLFAFILGTGCRVGEALGLTWNDCDFEEGLISINHTIKYYKLGESDEYGLSVNRTKTEAGVRIIPMLDTVRTILENEKRRQTDEGVADLCIDGMTGFVWRTKFGSLPIPGTVNAALYAIQRDYNEQVEANWTIGKKCVYLPKFSVHVLRHTFCTRLCENESNLKVIQEVMGHSSITVTMDVYNEATKDAKKESFKKLNGKVL